MILFPTLRSNPALDIGTPVARLMFCLTFVIPSAYFHEKLILGMGDDFFPITILFLFLKLCLEQFKNTLYSNLVKLT